MLSGCEGVSNLPEVFSVKQIIGLLEKRSFERFRFDNGYAYILSHEADEIFIEAPDDDIPNETAKLAADVLGCLDGYIDKAHVWLRYMNIDKDMFPDALDKGFEVCGMFFGKCRYGHDPSPAYGFSVSFRTAGYYPRSFTVKFRSDNMQPFAVEEWIQ